jgi:glyoxalase family protein
MRLDGLHHITAITADAPRNVDFYAGTLGLRLVKKTVNQDDPTVYHLFYADEDASPGADLTFFEYPGARRGRPGAGMVHRIVWRVDSDASLDFWEERLRDAGTSAQRTNAGRLRFANPEGLSHELAVVRTDDARLRAEHPEIAAEHALLGFDGVRALARDPIRSRTFLEGALGFAGDSDAYAVRGDHRGSFYAYDQADAPGLSGAGTIHHVAWSSTTEEQPEWRRRVVEAGGRPTEIIDRFYFKSVYFREPSGVLFEIATIGPGFEADEPKDRLGERLSLPPNYEHLRDQLEPILTPLPNPRATAGRGV